MLPDENNLKDLSLFGVPTLVLPSLNLEVWLVFWDSLEFFHDFHRPEGVR